MTKQSVTRDISRLLVRTENAIQFRGYQEFSSRQVAKVLDVEPAEVLHTLHLLKATGLVELLPGDGAQFSDKWRLAKGGGHYVYQRTNVRPICENHS